MAIAKKHLLPLNQSESEKRDMFGIMWQTPQLHAWMHLYIYS